MTDRKVEQEVLDIIDERRKSNFIVAARDLSTIYETEKLVAFDKQ